MTKNEAIDALAMKMQAQGGNAHPVEFYWRQAHVLYESCEVNLVYTAADAILNQTTSVAS